MKQVLDIKNKAGSRNPAEPRLVGDILAEMLSSDEPLAVAFRNRFPNTELGVDLKLFTRTHGRMNIGEVRSGAIIRDGEDHFTFFESAL